MKSPLLKFLETKVEFKQGSRTRLSTFADAYLKTVRPTSRPEWRSVEHVETVLERMGFAQNGTVYGMVPHGQ
jgi:hypothetical protein